MRTSCKNARKLWTRKLTCGPSNEIGSFVDVVSVETTSICFADGCRFCSSHFAPDTFFWMRFSKFSFEERVSKCNLILCDLLTVTSKCIRIIAVVANCTFEPISVWHRFLRLTFLLFAFLKNDEVEYNRTCASVWQLLSQTSPCANKIHKSHTLRGLYSPPTSTVYSVRAHNKLYAENSHTTKRTSHRVYFLME